MESFDWIYSQFCCTTFWKRKFVLMPTDVLGNNLSTIQYMHLLIYHFIHKKNRVNTENCTQLNHSTWEYAKCMQKQLKDLPASSVHCVLRGTPIIFDIITFCHISKNPFTSSQAANLPTPLPQANLRSFARSTKRIF